MLIVLSIFLISRPTQSLNFLVITFGVILVINGLIHIISYFSTKDDFMIFNFELIQGIISIITGLLFIFQPRIISTFLPFFVGVWIIIESVIKFQVALNLRGIEGTNWIMMLVLSILTAIIGIIIILNPFASAIALTTVCGILLLISEAINLCESIYLIAKLK